MIDEQISEEELLAEIESWEKPRIKAILKKAHEDPTLTKSLLDRYQGILQVLEVKSLGGLANLPDKWSRLNIEQKVKFINAWPKDRPFVCEDLSLDGVLEVDAWRYSTYTEQIGSLPDQIGQLKNIKELWLENQQLEELPPAIFELEDLEVLRLEENDLSALPADLGKVRKLRVLDLNSNFGLESLPDPEFLQNLEELNLENTRIKEVPESFFELKNLKEIVLENCELEKDTAMVRKFFKAFPDAKIETRAREAIEIEDAPDDEYLGMESIEVDDFHINYLPKALFKADVVKKLKIDCSCLKELPDTFASLSTLESLEFEIPFGAGKIPGSIAALKNLKRLVIEGRGAPWSLPENLGDLENLEELIIESGDFFTLPDSFGRLTNLKKLEMNSRDMKIPTAALELPKLKEVIIKSSGFFTPDELFHLPPCVKELDINISANDPIPFSAGKLINHLPKLDRLDVKGADFSEDKVEIEPHKSLREVHFQDSPLPTIPASFNNLTKLHTFSLLSCELRGIDASIYDCSSLVSFRITNVKFSTIPNGIERLENLEWFGFEEAGIKRLPKGIFQLKNLKQLVLGCPLFSDSSFKSEMKQRIKNLKISESWY